MANCIKELNKNKLDLQERSKLLDKFAKIATLILLDERIPSTNTVDQLNDALSEYKNLTLKSNCPYKDIENGWCKKQSCWTEAMPIIVYCNDVQKCESK